MLRYACIVLYCIVLYCIALYCIVCITWHVQGCQPLHVAQKAGYSAVMEMLQRYDTSLSSPRPIADAPLIATLKSRASMMQDNAMPMDAIAAAVTDPQSVVILKVCCNLLWDMFLNVLGFDSA